MPSAQAGADKYGCLVEGQWEKTNSPKHSQVGPILRGLFANEDI